MSWYVVPAAACGGVSPARSPDVVQADCAAGGPGGAGWVVAGDPPEPARDAEAPGAALVGDALCEVDAAAAVDLAVAE